jgi:hypothetical protein
MLKMNPVAKFVLWLLERGAEGRGKLDCRRRVNAERKKRERAVERS